MKQKRTNGTTLIELLVVIVVFLVGILAAIQIFPTGLDTLRTTRVMTIARQLARAESQVYAAMRDQMPELIAPVVYVGAGSFITVDTTREANELLPLGVDGLDNAGILSAGGNPLGPWAKVTGSNLISRVIGEGRSVPAPRPVGALYGTGSVLNLRFGPVYYERDAVSGIGVPGVVTAYTNDLELLDGDRDQDVPRLSAQRWDSWAAYFVPGTAATATGSTVAGFLNQDQIWVPRLGTGASLRHGFRVSMTMYYDDAGTVRPVDVIVTAPPVIGPFYDESPNWGTPPTNPSPYSIVSLPGLLNLTGGVYSPANYRGVLRNSLRIQRVYQELPLAVAFSAEDPLQYKMMNNSLGSLLVNPVAASVSIRNGATNVPLKVKADYSAFDWRILKEDLTVPTLAASSGADVKLMLNSIKAKDTQEPDGLASVGLGSTGADRSMWTPTPADGITPSSQDFVLVDVATGAVVVGNSAVDALSCYVVDKRRGVVTFRDADGVPGNGLSGFLSYAAPDSTANWTIEGPVAMEGRKVRAMYRGQVEFAVQPLKPANSYSVVYPAVAQPLGAGRVAIGGQNGWGVPNRLYFPLSDFGQRVTIGEIAYTDGANLSTTMEQGFRISGKEDFGGLVLAYVELPPGRTFDFSVAEPVKRVKGASMKVRVLWNPGTFAIGGTPAANLESFLNWHRGWRRVETETFVGAN